MIASSTQSRPTILRLKQVSSRVGLGRTAIYSRIAVGSFPKPISLGGGAVGWVDTEIDGWITAMIDESRTGTSGLTFTDRAKKAAAVRWDKARTDAGAARSEV